MLYHYNDEKKFKALDILTASGLIACNWIACALFQFRAPYFPLALVFLACSIYFFVRQHVEQRHINHALWHVSSVAITLCCVLGMGSMIH
jgi:uncharacterized membrane protein